jgi:hypothetical protein
VRLAKDDTIAGLPAKLARDVVRQLAVETTPYVLGARLGFTSDEAVKVISGLHACGYIEPVGPPGSPERTVWITTIAGNALAQASFLARITRTTADQHLERVIAATRSYNANADNLLADVIVFGSYLDPTQDRLGDLDIGLTVLYRFEDRAEYARRCREGAASSGQRMSTFIDKLFWPERHLVKHLRGRSNTIKITFEDVTQLTDRARTVYRIIDDLDAVQPPSEVAIYGR